MMSFTIPVSRATTLCIATGLVVRLPLLLVIDGLLCLKQPITYTNKIANNKPLTLQNQEK